MSLSKEEINHVARLARLELTEKETEEYTRQLNEILGYVEKLRQLPTEEVEPTAHAIPLTNVFREDKTWASLDREEVLANAPQREEAFFRVPRILEEN